MQWHQLDHMQAIYTSLQTDNHANTLRANTSIGQQSFSIAAPVVWNALPTDLRSLLNSRQQLRSKLKTHFFRQAYNTA